MSRTVLGYYLAKPGMKCELELLAYITDLETTEGCVAEDSTSVVWAEFKRVFNGGRWK